MPNPDFFISTRDGRRVLNVEAKRRHWSLEQAQEWRKDIHEKGEFPSADFLLLALSDKFYLWNEKGRSGADTPYILDANKALQRFLPFNQSDLAAVQPSTFELMVGMWLGELVYWEKPVEAVRDEQAEVVDSGLYEAVIGGDVIHSDTTVRP